MEVAESKILKASLQEKEITMAEMETYLTQRRFDCRLFYGLASKGNCLFLYCLDSKLFQTNKVIDYFLR